MLRVRETILRVIFFQNFKIFKCSYLWPKRPQSGSKVSGDNFDGQGDHFKGQNLFKISKFSNVLIFGQNVHKVEQKCRETILRVRETILGVNFFSKFQNFQMFLSLAKTSTKVEQKCRETILRIRETILRVKICSKFQNFQMFLSLAKTSTKLNKSVERPF